MNKFLRNLLKGVQFTALLAVASAASAAGPGSQYQVVDGVAMYLGVLPAEMIQGHPKGAMHGGISSRKEYHPRKEYHHIVIALFDSASGERVTDAQVKAKVEEPGHLRASEKALEPMTIADTITYGNYFRMPGKGPYQIAIEIRRPGVPQVIESRFEYRHP